MRRALAATLLTTCLLAGGTALVSSAPAAPTKTRGTITISGAIHSARKLTVAGQCHALRLPPGLTVNLSFGPRVRKGVYGYPQLTITQETKGASTNRVDLAKTKDYTVQLTGPATQNSWLAGWNALSGTQLTHIGSGSLTMSSNGKSGTLQATMLRYTGTIKGTVQVRATWSC